MSRYINTPIILSPPKKERRGFPIQRSTRYPEIPTDINDIYAYTTEGDRLDLLAEQFYNDVTLYWIISISNPNKLNLGSLFPPPGSQLRIPVNISGIVASYNQLNEL